MWAIELRKCAKRRIKMEMNWFNAFMFFVMIKWNENKALWWWSCVAFFIYVNLDFYAAFVVVVFFFFFIFFQHVDKKEKRSFYCMFWFRFYCPMYCLLFFRRGIYVIAKSKQCFIGRSSSTCSHTHMHIKEANNHLSIAKISTIKPDKSVWSSCFFLCCFYFPHIQLVYDCLWGSGVAFFTWVLYPLSV